MNSEFEYRVSIIIPVYNVEKYVEECFVSLVNQTLDGIQLIIVDNGCLDKSVEIVEKILKNHHNYRIVKLEKNVGLAQARNIGMKYAVGEYISFVDSDDLCDTQMYELMYGQAQRLDADIVVCNVMSFITGKKDGHPHHAQCLYQEDEKTYSIKGHPQLWIEMAAWAKLVKRSYAEFVGYSFTPNSLCCEDVPGATRLFVNTSKIAILNECLYFYRNRPGSLSKKTSYKYAKDFAWAMNQQDKIVDKLPSIDNVNLYYIFLVRLLLANHVLTHMQKKDIKKSLNEISTAFNRFDDAFIEKACTYSAFNKEVVKTIIDKNISKYLYLVKD